MSESSQSKLINEQHINGFSGVDTLGSLDNISFDNLFNSGVLVPKLVSRVLKPTLSPTGCIGLIFQHVKLSKVPCSKYVWDLRSKMCEVPMRLVIVPGRFELLSKACSGRESG